MEAKDTYTLHIGTLLAQGKYRIDAVLGQGGFGVTYRGTHTVLNTTVAIKEFFMKGACERDDQSTHVSTTQSNRELADRFRNKFVKEAQMLAALKHPGIIRVFDIFEENGTAYYVMDFVEGNNLQEIVTRQGHLPEADALRYIKEVADALGYVHRHKMLHLDVKPANILIDNATQRAVLIDFGVAKQYDEGGQQTSTTPTAISKGYSPIEQYTQGAGVESFSPATDIYALAATLYKLLTGITPPESNLLLTEEETLPPYPVGISESVKNAIAQSLKSRKKRPQSIAEFLALLNTPTARPTASTDEETRILTDDATQKQTNPADEETQLISTSSQPNTETNIPTPTEKKRLRLKITLAAIGALVVVLLIMIQRGCFIHTTVEVTDASADTDSITAMTIEEERADDVDETEIGEVDKARKRIYNILKDGGYQQSFEVFNAAMNADSNNARKKVYDLLKKHGFYNDTFEEFNRYMGEIHAPLNANEKTSTPNTPQTQHGKKTYKEGTYEGDLLNGMPHGTGTFKWRKNSETLTAQWENGRPSKGMWHLCNGATYAGELTSDAEDCFSIHINGKGTYTFKGGGKVVGTFSDGYPVKGTFHYTNGDWYEGELNRYWQRSGQGTYYFQDGRKVTGQWSEENPVRGTYYYRSGDWYEGSFNSKWQRNGQGTLYNADGSVGFSGQWINNEAVR